MSSSPARGALRSKVRGKWGEEEKGKHRNDHDACSAERPLILLLLAEVQRLVMALDV